MFSKLMKKSDLLEREKELIEKEMHLYKRRLAIDVEVEQYMERERLFEKRKEDTEKLHEKKVDLAQLDTKICYEEKIIKLKQEHAEEMQNTINAMNKSLIEEKGKLLREMEIIKKQQASKIEDIARKHVEENEEGIRAIGEVNALRDVVEKLQEQFVLLNKSLNSSVVTAPKLHMITPIVGGEQGQDNK